MNATTQCPGPNRLHALVGCRLTPVEEAELTVHLETCCDCQDQLDTLAAGEESWSAAREIPRSEAAPEPALVQLIEQSRTLDLRSPARSDGPTVRELSLEFLAPPAQSGGLGRLGHYEVLEVIGRGGMGIVLKAFDEKLQRTVAIKVLAPELASSPVARERFIREARAAAGIRDDHVIDIHAVEDAAPLPYLVMEHIAGGSLQQRLDCEGPLPPAEVARIGVEAARGLAAAHSRGCIHRDIKPANLLLDRAGRVKISDFGLARAVDDASGSQQGVVAGTPEYMAPEQARGEVPDPRADLFSLGSTLYALCTGAPPFAAGNTLAVLQRVSSDRPFPISALNPAISAELSAIIEKLHAKNPAERYQSAAEVMDALQRGAAPGPAVAANPALRPLQRRRGSWGALATAAACLGLGVLIAAQIIIRIRDKDGKVTEHKVPAGASVDIERDGKVVAQVAPGLGPVGEARKFLGHRGAVWSVAFTPTGRHILSAGSDGSVRVWDTLSEDRRPSFEGHRDFVFAVVACPDGRRALSGSGKQVGTGVAEWKVCLWEIETGKELRHLSGHGQAVTCLALTPDGKRALIGNYDGTVWLYDVAEWKELRRLQTDQHLWSVAISADGKQVLTAAGYNLDSPAPGYGNRGPIRIWDLETGKEATRLDGHADGVWRAIFSPDGKQVLSVGGDRMMRSWDVAQAKELDRLRHDEPVAGLAVSADGKRLVSGVHDMTVRLWDIEKRKELCCFKGHTMGVQTVALSPDGQYAVSGGLDGSVRLWRLPRE